MMEAAQEMRQIENPPKMSFQKGSKDKANTLSDSDDGLKSFEGEITRAMDGPHLQEDSDDVKSMGGNSTAVENEKPQSLSTNFRDWQQAYEDTRAELKSMDRDIRDQSLEIRDLKRQNALLNERNGDLREKYNQIREVQRARPEKLLKSEKSKYIEHFEILEEHINHLQYERQKRDAHMESLTAQTREANEEKASLEAANRRLQRQVKELSDNLTECKDDLLRLQPTSQVSENEISDQYANLDQQISGWVDDRTEDAQVLEEQIDKIKSVDDLPQLFKQYMSSDRLKLAKKFPESQPLLLRYLIHCCLGTFVLGNDIYLFGLDSRNIALLQGIEVGMKSLEPRRDAATLRHWRSEALRGLLEMESFAEEQERQAQLVSQTLQEALTSLVSESFGSWQEIHKQIVVPAIELSTKLRLSTSDYVLTSRRFVKDSGPGSSVFVYEVKDSCMIDITTQKVIRPDSNLKIAEDGRIGQEMLVLTPALLRDQKEGKNRVLVCKPTVLVKLDEPMGKRSRGIRALGAWTPSWFGGEEPAE